MSSNCIYSTHQHYIPFTYLIGWSHLNKWYYGRKTQDGCNPSDLWNTYFTSSKTVKEFIKLHGDPDIIQIRQTFFDPEKCVIWENKVLRRLNAKLNEKFLNRTDGDGRFDTTGMVLAVDQNGHRYFISNNDPRYVSGELVPIMRNRPQRSKNKNTVVVRDENGKPIRISKDDPRYLSGELKGVKYGHVNVKDEYGNVFDVAKNDPRYLSGELKHISLGTENHSRKNKVTVKDHDGKNIVIDKDDPRFLSGELQHCIKGIKKLYRKKGKQKIVRCPHCGVEGGFGIMKRWHFNNCHRIKNNT